MWVTFHSFGGGGMIVNHKAFKPEESQSRWALVIHLLKSHTLNLGFNRHDVLVFGGFHIYLGISSTFTQSQQCWNHEYTLWRTVSFTLDWEHVVNLHGRLPDEWAHAPTELNGLSVFVLRATAHCKVWVATCSSALYLLSSFSRVAWSGSHEVHWQRKIVTRTNIKLLRTVPLPSNFILVSENRLVINYSVITD